MKNHHNPYRSIAGEWIRVNLHGHCAENSSCASVPLMKGVSMYRDIGADAMAVTDHDCITDLSAVQNTFRDMIFINGFEYSSSENVVFIGEDVPKLYKLSLSEALQKANGLMTIICHPEPNRHGEYWPLDKLEDLGHMPLGVEVYNGHYSVPKMRDRGANPYYARFWDKLLSSGYKIWGFANDDFHDLVDFDNAFNMVHVKNRSASGILDSVKNGRCYGSTGLLISHMDESENAIRITVSAPSEGKFIGLDGRVLSSNRGQIFECSPADVPYVRFEAESDDGLLFLQPFFRE